MKNKVSLKKLIFITSFIFTIAVIVSIYTFSSNASGTEEKGKEYDFSDKENNEKYDVKDSGAKKDGYDLIWSDEFDGNYKTKNIDENTGLNLDNWSYQLGDGSVDANNYGWGNKELQSYSNRKKNIAVNEDLSKDGKGDGLLRITASYENDGFSHYDKESKKDYSSARIRSTKGDKALFNTTYGYIEARISTPATKGAWPAFWLLPESTDIYGNWPVSGEIDILETVGAFADGTNNQAIGTVHWGNPEHMQKSCGYVTLGSDYTYFHKYAVDWQPGKITWFYDDKEIYSIKNWGSKFNGAFDELGFDAPFDQPFFILLNMAVDSGVFGKNANVANFDGDINMYVDYVRCFQKSDGYEKTAKKTSIDDANDDWKKYEGKNQVADISSDALVSDVKDGDVSSLETKGSIDNSKWYLGYQADATDATLTSEEKDGKTYAKVGINSTGELDYSIQLIGHYDAKAGYAYKVSFDGYADGDMVGKTIGVSSKEWRGWSSYGGGDFELTDSPKTYEYTLRQAEDFEKLRYEINLGNRGKGNVYIGNVKVEIIDPALVSIVKKAHTELKDGNLIYNGTFDQGNEHIAYWKSDNNTSLEVPRYTTDDLTGKDVKVVDIASQTNYEKVKKGLKYYERRGQVSSNSSKSTIYQPEMNLKAGIYDLTFDLYSKDDVNVEASVYTMKDEALDKKIVSQNTSKMKKGNVEKVTMQLVLDQDVNEGALAFTFDKDVQIDNVSMKMKKEKQKPKPIALDSSTKWSAEDGQGKTFEVKEDKDVLSVENLTSGAQWWQSQIIGSDFTLVEDNEYTISFKYKMEGNSNKQFEYIIQENGNDWYVYNDGPTKVEYDKEKVDKDGFATYETTFMADKTLDTVHLVFGFGNSESDGSLKFSFKDVSVKLKDGEEIDNPNDKPSVEPKPADNPNNNEDKKQDGFFDGITKTFNKIKNDVSNFFKDTFKKIGNFFKRKK